jgi:ADP-ribose pyrophosphatase
MDLFFFGSLRDSEMRAAVLGDPCHSSAVVPDAHLPGFSAERAAGYDFPVLVENPAGMCPGVLVSGIGETGLDRLRFFEDTEYALHPVGIVCGGETRAAHAFFGIGLAASGEPWVLEDWAATAKPLMLAVTRELMGEWYGRAAPGQVDAIWHRIYNRLKPTFAPPDIDAL